NPTFVNDIGAEYIIRLLIHGTQIRTELINLNTLESSSIAYTVDGDTISLSFNWTLMQELQNFDCVALARSWFNKGLVAADKAPNEGHYSFSAFIKDDLYGTATLTPRNGLIVILKRLARLLRCNVINPSPLISITLLSSILHS
ncbi:MAG: hypothetical protein JSV32_02785, partial [Dehalococcoidia bacterium]